jgi:hypothetical protein
MAISLAPQELFGQNQNALKFQKKCKADIFYFDLGLALLTGPPFFLKKNVFPTFRMYSVRFPRIWIGWATQNLGRPLLRGTELFFMSKSVGTWH